LCLCGRCRCPLVRRGAWLTLRAATAPGRAMEGISCSFKARICTWRTPTAQGRIFSSPPRLPRMVPRSLPMGAGSAFRSMIRPTRTLCGRSAPTDPICINCSRAGTIRRRRTGAAGPRMGATTSSTAAKAKATIFSLSRTPSECFAKLPLFPRN
jgi:hypothetical protein